MIEIIITSWNFSSYKVLFPLARVAFGQSALDLCFNFNSKLLANQNTSKLLQNRFNFIFNCFQECTK